MLLPRLLYALGLILIALLKSIRASSELSKAYNAIPNYDSI